MDKKTIQEKLQAVKDAYIADLPVKMERIETLWQSLQQQWRSETAETLHILVHGLAGSAETFGLPQVTAKARHADQFLKQLENHAAPDMLLQQNLHQALQELLAEADKVSVV